MRAGATAEAISQLHCDAKAIEPVTLAQQRRLQVLPALAQLLPNGLARGSTLEVRGDGAMSLALAVAAGPVAAGSWLATVGCDELCLLGAEQAGVALQRTVMVDQPPKASWGTVVAALVDAFEVVLVSGAYRVGARDARRLLSRARERGSVVIDVGGVWPEAHDIVLEATGQVWSGIGVGYGSLTTRRVLVEVSGRRGTRPQQAPLLLPGTSLAPDKAEEASFLCELAPSRGFNSHKNADMGRVG